MPHRLMNNAQKPTQTNCRFGEMLNALSRRRATDAYGSYVRLLYRCSLARDEDLITTSAIEEGQCRLPLRTPPTLMRPTPHPRGCRRRLSRRNDDPSPRPGKLEWDAKPVALIQHFTAENGVGTAVAERWAGCSVIDKCWKFVAIMFVDADVIRCNRRVCNALLLRRSNWNCLRNCL